MLTKNRRKWSLEELLWIFTQGAYRMKCMQHSTFLPNWDTLYATDSSAYSIIYLLGGNSSVLKFTVVEVCRLTRFRHKGLGKRGEEKLEKWARNCCWLILKSAITMLLGQVTFHGDSTASHKNLSEHFIILMAGKCFLMLNFKLIWWRLCPSLFITEVAKRFFSFFWLNFRSLLFFFSSCFWLYFSF